MNDTDGIEKEMYRSRSLQLESPCYGCKEFEMQHQGNNEAVTGFLGEGPRAVEAYNPPWYYRHLLAWTVKCAVLSPGWEAISVHGYTYDKPVFSDIQTGYLEHESCMTNGQMLMQEGDVRMIITLNAGLVQVEAQAEHHGVTKKLLQDIQDFMKEHNFYRGKRLNFDGGISFLNAGQRTWDSIILDPEIKKGIRLNTIGFLKNIGRMQEYGISPKRGIILAGDPGTGKTIVCKALMSEAESITCITTNAYGEVMEGYFSDLYALAQDLSPSMVFIEDIDFSGQERSDFYHGSPPLLSLLGEMDGIEEKTAIVTIATSNCFEKLDKALSERPSRFDRVFKIPRPDYQRRLEMLERLANKIPMSGDIREYTARKTEGFTPAQLQEVPNGMVIAQLDKTDEVTDFSRQDVDAAIYQINHKKDVTIGFKPVAG